MSSCDKNLIFYLLDEFEWKEKFEKLNNHRIGVF